MEERDFVGAGRREIEDTVTERKIPVEVEVRISTQAILPWRRMGWRVEGIM